MNVKDLIKDNVCKFSRYKNGCLFYKIERDNGHFEFPVDLKSIPKNSEFPAEGKAANFAIHITKYFENLY